MDNPKQNDVKSKTWKLFIAAVIFALLAGTGTMIYLKVLEHRLKARLTPAEKEMVHVIVASQNQPAGTVINTSTMAVRAVPKEYVNSDVFTPDQFDSIQGAVLIKPLQQGNMLSQAYIDLNIPKDFSGTIQVGHRAVTIQVDEMNSISGMIRPGNFIDLFTRISAGSIPTLASSDSGDVFIPVLEDVLVLATDKTSARPNEDEFKSLDPDDRRRTYNTLTLEVTPKEAGLIAIAESRGELSAALRNTNDTDGILFNKITLADLISHSGELLESAINKQHNRNIDGIYADKDGQLATRDGVAIKDPNIHLNKDGLLVTRNGTVLSGRDLVVDNEGRIRSKDGKLVDTASLVAARNGTLVDKNGTVLGTNGYATTKGGFLVDKDGNVITHDGNILSGVTVGKDGQVRTPGGEVISADQISVGKDGQVRIVAARTPAMSVDQDGNLRTVDGKLVKPADLVTVGADGVVRTKDGKVLQGVTVDKDGALHAADGKNLTSTDVLMAAAGFKQNQDGTITDENGKAYAVKDLVTVGRDGKIRTKDGTVVDGVSIDKNGKLRNQDGTLLTAQQLFVQSANAKAASAEGRVLSGVRGRHDAGFARSFNQNIPDKGRQYIPYEVEYIIGGQSDGAAKTFNVQIETESKDGIRKQ